MKIGRTEGLPSDEYHAFDACSSSRLAKMRRSPAHCLASLEAPDSTPALDFGTAVHVSVLEPDTFDAAYSLDPEHPDGGYPKGWRNTTDYRETRDAILGAGRKLLAKADREACLRIRDAVWNAGGDVSAIMTAKTATEVSYLARDPDHDAGDGGLLCKCRPDIEVAPARTVVDLKTALDASEWAFAKSISTYGYHIARAFYMHTLDLAGLDRWDHYLFLVVEKAPPWGVALYDLDPDAADQGQREMDSLLELYARCKATGHWPAFPPDVRTVGIPGYAFKETETDE